jgi:hypothetical protein
MFLLKLKALHATLVLNAQRIEKDTERRTNEGIQDSEQRSGANKVRYISN